MRSSQSPGLDRADKSSRCSGCFSPCHRKLFSLSLRLRSLFLFTVTFRERSTKMYELKPELRVLLPTLSPSLRHPSCSFSRGKSGIYRLLGKADGSAHIAYLPVRADQTLMQAGEQNPLKRVARSTMYTVTMCKHPFRGPP